MAESHDPALNQDTLRLAGENRQIEALKYEADVNVFRASVNLKLLGLGLLTGNAWMFFKMYGDDHGLGYGYPAPSERSTLVMMRPIVIEHEGKKRTTPDIRIFKTERYNFRHGCEHIVTDVTVDEDGDAAYLIDSIFQPETCEETDGPILPKKPALPKPVLALPWITDERLTFIGSPGEMTPPVNIYGPGINKFRFVSPYGEWNNLTDQQYALKRASELFAEVEGLEPDIATVQKG